MYSSKLVFDEKTVYSLDLLITLNVFLSLITLIFFYLVRPVPGLESGPQQLVQLGPGLTQQHDTPGKIQVYRGEFSLHPSIKYPETEM
jgi:hypothetical protein